MWMDGVDRSTIRDARSADRPLDLQAKLLHVLEEQEFKRIGSTQTIRSSLRGTLLSKMQKLGTAPGDAAAATSRRTGTPSGVIAL